MGNHTGNDRVHNDGVALDRADRHLRLSGIGRFLWAETNTDHSDPRLFAVHRSHRLCAGPAATLDLHVDHSHSDFGREPCRRADGQRNRADEVARDRTRGVIGAYPIDYMLCSLTALVAVPLWGWRSLYWLGILPALLVLWVRIGIKESPRFTHVSAVMVREGLKKRLDIWSPARNYRREMTIAVSVYFCYFFTWLGWSAWMPQFLANEKHLGFQATTSYLSIWMRVAIFGYYVCGSL